MRISGTENGGRFLFIHFDIEYYKSKIEIVPRDIHNLVA